MNTPTNPNVVQGTKTEITLGILGILAILGLYVYAEKKFNPKVWEK